MMMVYKDIPKNVINRFLKFKLGHLGIEHRKLIHEFR